MKRILGFLLALTLITGNIFAQSIKEKNVPAVVLNAFQLKFPNAENVDWSFEEDNYLISFEVNNKRHKLYLTDRGNMLEHHQDLYVSEIPESVLNAIKSKLALFDLRDADRITEGNNIIYEINLENRNKDHDFRISEAGDIIKYRKELRKSELPQETRKLIRNKYGDLDIHRAVYFEENGKILYYFRGEINGKDHRFIFEGKTKLLLHKQDLRYSEIPDPVLITVKTKYSGYDIRDADLREENGNRTYTIRLRKYRENTYVIFDTEGNIIKVRKK